MHVCNAFWLLYPYYLYLKLSLVNSSPPAPLPHPCLLPLFCDPLSLTRASQVTMDFQLVPRTFIVLRCTASPPKVIHSIMQSSNTNLMICQASFRPHIYDTTLPPNPTCWKLLWMVEELREVRYLHADPVGLIILVRSYGFTRDREWIFEKI